MKKSFKKHQLKYKVNKNRRLIGGAKIKRKSLKNRRHRELKNLRSLRTIRNHRNLRNLKNLRNTKKSIKSLRKKNLKKQRKNSKKNMKGGFISFGKNKDRVLIDAMCNQLDDEFRNNPRRIDGYINALCPQNTGIIGGAVNMINPMNNGVFDLAKKAVSVATSPVRKIIQGVSGGVLNNQQMPNIQSMQPMQSIQPIQPVQQVRHIDVPIHKPKTVVSTVKKSSPKLKKKIIYRTNSEKIN